LDNPPEKPTPLEYEIELSDSAAEAYGRFYENARAAESRGESTSYHCTALRQIDEALEKIIPYDPFNKRHALVGDLKSIYRLHKGRMRICWIGSSKNRKVCVLFISETPRKAGDTNDPYKILYKRVVTGEFDHLFEMLGMKPPSRSQTNSVQ